jgi:hypothetical protein
MRKKPSTKSAAEAGARAFARLPNAVARDKRISELLLCIIAFRLTYATDRSQYGLNETRIKGLFRGGLGVNRTRRAIADAQKLGLLKRHQSPRGGNGRWGHAVDVLTLPDCGASGHAYRHVRREWFNRTLSVQELAALLFLRAGTGKGRNTFKRELAERFGWSPKKAGKLLRGLQTRGRIDKKVFRSVDGRFKWTAYAPASARPSPSASEKKASTGSNTATTGQEPCSGFPCGGFPCDTRSIPLHALSSGDSLPQREPPRRTRRGRYTSEEAPTTFCDEQAWSSDVLLGWIAKAEPRERAMFRAISPTTLVEIGDVAEDAVLRPLVLEAAQKRVAAKILTPPGLQAIRYIAASLVNEDDDVDAVGAIVAVLNAMWSRIGSRPGAWLNSLALIGKRLTYGAGGTHFYVDGGQPKFRVGEQPITAQSPAQDGRPIPETPELLMLVENDPAKTLAPKLLRDAWALRKFLDKHGGEPALHVMIHILWRHAVDGKPKGSVKSWRYFEGAIAEVRHKDEMSDLGVKPGAAFGTQKKWGTSDA